MLNYYKANYPRPSDASQLPTVKNPPIALPKIKCPVMMFHGLKDKALLASGLNGTWEWIDNELTLVTIASADHFVQHDAPELVTRKMVNWLATEDR